MNKKAVGTHHNMLNLKGVVMQWCQDNAHRSKWWMVHSLPPLDEMLCAAKDSWWWGQGDGRWLSAAVIRILKVMGQPSCHIWWRCEAVLRRQWVQRPCVLIGDREEEGFLDTAGAIVCQIAKLDLDSIFIVDVLWLPPNFESFFRSRGQRSRKWPTHGFRKVQASEDKHWWWHVVLGHLGHSHQDDAQSIDLQAVSNLQVSNKWRQE